MTVYVDDFRILATVGPYTAYWSHLFTDSDDLTELHDFAASIGLRRHWFQDKPSGAHYDLTDRYRQRALRAGAHPIPWRHIRTVWPPNPSRKRNRRETTNTTIPSGLETNRTQQ